jgi:hypothetical protein
MRLNSKSFSIITGLCLLAGVLVVLYFPRKPATESPVPNEIANSSEKPKKRPYVEPTIENFPRLTPGQQLDLVTKLMSNRNLSADILSFLKREVANKKLPELTRNNIANGLVYQREKDPELFKVFMNMASDKAESIKWRDYSLQFLGETLAFASDPATVQTRLLEVARSSEETLAGTAIIHLALNEAKGVIKLDESFSDLLITRLADQRLPVAAKVSILGVIGKRKDKRQIEVVRLFAGQQKNDGLKRSAIAALGLIGEQSDIELIKPALKHKNRAVVLAAKGAIKRLEKRQK